MNANQLPEDPQFTDAVVRLDVEPIEQGKKISASASVRLHRCHIFGDMKPTRCTCHYIDDTQAEELLQNGAASWYQYNRTVMGEVIVCASKSNLVLHQNEIEFEYAKEQAELFALFERHAAERLETFNVRLPILLRDFRKQAWKNGVHDIYQTPDQTILNALEEETGNLNGLVPWPKVKAFHLLMSRYWDMILDRDNLSMARGEKVTGATYLTKLAGGTFDMGPLVDRRTSALPGSPGTVGHSLEGHPPAKSGWKASMDGSKGPDDEES
jgi:hypothetical protein